MFNDQNNNQNNQSAPQDIFDPTGSASAPVPMPMPSSEPVYPQNQNSIPTAPNPVLSNYTAPGVLPVSGPNNPVIHTMTGDATTLRPVNRADSNDPWSQLSVEERAALESIRPSRWRQILVGILLIVAIIGGIYVAWRYVPWLTLLARFFPTTAEVKTPVVTPEVKENYLNQIIQNSDNNAIPAPTPTDTDRDGLTDEEEIQVGTKIDNPDSDDDDLSDIVEVKTYKTNPLKADSDDDGYFDGKEVKEGLDPLNAHPDAKLLQINSETINQAQPAN